MPDVSGQAIFWDIKRRTVLILYLTFWDNLSVQSSYDLSVNCNWVATRWQQYNTHLHTHTRARARARTHTPHAHNAQNDTKQTIHRTTQKFGRLLAVPRLCGFCPGICLKTDEKAWKNLSQGSRRVPAGTTKIHKHTIRIHRRNNKNT